MDKVLFLNVNLIFLLEWSVTEIYALKRLRPKVIFWFIRLFTLGF